MPSPPVTHNRDTTHEIVRRVDVEVTSELDHAMDPPAGFSLSSTFPSRITTAQNVIDGHETPAKLSWSFVVTTCCTHAPLAGDVEA
jgi:hypothetical protein